MGAKCNKMESIAILRERQNRKLKELIKMKKRNTCTMLMGMQTGAASRENSMEFLEKN